MYTVFIFALCFFWFPIHKICKKPESRPSTKLNIREISKYRRTGNLRILIRMKFNSIKIYNRHPILPLDIRYDLELLEVDDKPYDLHDMLLDSAKFSLINEGDFSRSYKY